VILFFMHEPSDKTFRIDEKDDGGVSVPDGFAVKAGLVGTGEPAMSVQKGEVRKSDPRKLRDRQQQRKIEIKSNFWVGQTLESEVVVIQQVVELASILQGKNHRPFLVHFFQAFLGAFVQLRALEEAVEKPAQQETGSEIQRVGIVNPVSEGVQGITLCLRGPIVNWIRPPNQVICLLQVFEPR
jgi:hypothetical protein